jgi:hypothetical protein
MVGGDFFFGQALAFLGGGQGRRGDGGDVARAAIGDLGFDQSLAHKKVG